MKIEELIEMFLFLKEQEEEIKVKKKEIRQKIGESLQGEDYCHERFMVLHRKHYCGIKFDSLPKELNEQIEPYKIFKETFYILRKEDNEN